MSGTYNHNNNLSNPANVIAQDMLVNPRARQAYR